MVWGTAFKILGSLAKKAGPLVKSSRKMPPPRIQGSTPKNKPRNVKTQAAVAISKESKAIGAQGINQYNDILRQIPEGPIKKELLSDLETKVWNRADLTQRAKLDEAIQMLLRNGINIRRGINSRGITEIAQIKPYGYWAVRLPQGEVRFGFSYPALLKLSEKLTPIQKSRFLSALEEALRLPQKPGGSSKIAGLIKTTNDNISILIGNIELGGKLWKDGVYIINLIGK